ncbi:MAG: hypothetical protein II779_13725 [Clostridia bacterium]|nr:hypothetical protein [Clostridia bacterium]
MNKPENGDTPPKNEFLTPGYCFGRIGLFIVCGLIVLLVYFVLMFPLQGVLGEWAEKAETEGSSVPENIMFVLYALFYLLPLYVLFFARDVGLKTRVLHLTEEGWDLRKVFEGVYRSTGWIDHALYAAYSLLLLLPFGGGDPFLNPFSFLTIQEMFFFTVPLPKIVGWFLAVLCFAAEYALCLLVSAKWWDAHRIRRSDSRER